MSENSDDTRHLVFNRMEIISIMHGLIKQRELVSATFNSNELVLTAVLKVDADNNRLFLDYGPNEMVNQRILKAGKIHFNTVLDNVKIEFASTEISTINFDGANAFLIPLPPQVRRLQRREYYRVATPVVAPVVCRIPVAGKIQDIPLIDISAGGVGLILPPDNQTLLELAASYPGCRINLPGIGEVEVSLSVQNTQEVTMKNGKKYQRTGCLFQNIRPGTQAVIQRYITKLERERITRKSDR
ncbi:MAG TPA: flagellar brake protein [Methylophilaceae bacterium]|nr:flagellar brake protein [Methylophilaceae bacterium]